MVQVSASNEAFLFWFRLPFTCRTADFWNQFPGCNLLKPQPSFWQCKLANRETCDSGDYTNSKRPITLRGVAPGKLICREIQPVLTFHPCSTIILLFLLLFLQQQSRKDWWEVKPSSSGINWLLWSEVTLTSSATRRLELKCRNYFNFYARPEKCVVQQQERNTRQARCTTGKQWI